MKLILLTIMLFIIILVEFIIVVKHIKKYGKCDGIFWLTFVELSCLIFLSGIIMKTLYVLI